MQIGILNILDNFHRSDEIRETYQIFNETNCFMRCSWYFKRNPDFINNMLYDTAIHLRQ